MSEVSTQTCCCCSEPTPPCPCTCPERVSLAVSGIVTFDPATLPESGGCTHYSTEEQWTGKYWIDGKKIYQKTVDCGAMPNNAYKHVEHGIANMDNIMSWEAISRRDSDGSRLFLPFYNPRSTTAGIGIIATTTLIKLLAIGDQRTFSPTYVTLFYTCTDR